MGSFSVSCGITKLTITSGEKCVLLPLITPKNYQKSKRELYGSLRSTSMILYPYDMWEPFSFPIKGTYNDYGSLEDIKKDENTKILENYLEMSIEDFVALITDGRKDVYDTYSKYNEVFYLYPKDLKYNSNMEDFLLHLGFIKSTKTNYFIFDNCEIILEPTKNTFIAQFKDIEKKYCYNDKEDFLKDYKIYTDKYLGVKNEKKLNLLLAVGGMFMLRDAYDFYTNNHMNENENLVSNYEITKHCLLKANFETKDFNVFTKTINNKPIEVVFDNYNSINGKTFYNMEEFLAEYMSITSEEFNISIYDGIDIYKWEQLEQENLNFELIKNHIILNSFDEDLKFPNWEDKTEVVQFLGKFMKHEYYFIQDLVPYCELLKTFTSLRDIYFSNIIVGNLLDYFTEFRRFFRSIYLSNILLCPTFCGTQCGCREAEVKLAYITNKIVENRENYLKDEYNDYQTVNPLKGFNDRFY